LARETHALPITRECLAAVGQRDDATVVLPCGGVLISGPCMTSFSMRRHAPGSPCNVNMLLATACSRAVVACTSTARLQVPCFACSEGQTGEGVWGVGNRATGALQSWCGGLQSGCKALVQRVWSSSAEWIRPNFWEQWNADEPCFEDSAMLHKTLYM
jgi:hypothetical protein